MKNEADEVYKARKERVGNLRLTVGLLNKKSTLLRLLFGGKFEQTLFE
jgi:hypothetical protein